MAIEEANGGVTSIDSSAANNAGCPSISFSLQTAKTAEKSTDVEQQTDHKDRNWMLPLYAVAISFGSFICGTVLGYPSPAIPSFNSTSTHFTMNHEQNSWVGSVSTLAAIIGSLLAMPYMDYFGRKAGLLYLAAPFACGWLNIVFSRNFIVLVTGRVITGVCTGFYLVICPVYFKEISSPSFHHFIILFNQLATCSGIFFTYCFGVVLSWSWLAVACEGILPLMAIMIIFTPESPYWLLSTGKKSETEYALLWLHGKCSNITAEMKKLEDMIREAENKASWKDFFNLQYLKHLSICLGMMLFQQCSGISIITYYTVDIFQMTCEDLDPHIQTVIVGGVGVVGSIVAIFTANLVRRKLLLVTTAAVMILCTGGLAMFLYEINVRHFWIPQLRWVPATCLVTFNFVFHIAWGPVPWALLDEVFPSNAKKVAKCTTSIFHYLCAFVLTKVFVQMSYEISLQCMFWFFSGFFALSIPFVLFFFTETQGPN